MQHLYRTFGTGIEKIYINISTTVPTFFRSPARAAVGHFQVGLPWAKYQAKGILEDIYDAFLSFFVVNSPGGDWLHSRSACYRTVYLLYKWVSWPGSLPT
jgi:hypothetical protein